jgi:prepilin-type N-terminal cleavage/methylation domain-containing protein/prepilin-type processing-associated H-X9-DG protein
MQYTRWRSRSGFTLIELLVVIAIIAILAAMLFPVFARARESARKIQCLSNVKNIAMAMQLYFTDYDKFPPAESRPEVVDFFKQKGGGSCAAGTMSQANPYLRWPVILDEYIKNRDVWRCPSAKTAATPECIIPTIYPDWLTWYKNHQVCICIWAWPQGWGGTVTDSDDDGSLCHWASVDSGATEISLPINERNLGKSLSIVDDPAKYVFVADRGIKSNWWAVEQIAFPDVCRVKWGAVVDRTGCSADWANPNCANSLTCGVDYHLINKFWTDASMRDQYTRHLGGSNLGFLDGHAAWWKADAIIAGAGNRHNPNPELDGMDCQCLPASM